MAAQTTKNRPTPRNIRPDQKSFGLLIFIAPLLLAAAAKCNMRPAIIGLRSMSAFRCVLLALLSVLLVGCGERPKLARLPESAAVLASGDRLTFGTGANEHETYPAHQEPLT